MTDHKKEQGMSEQVKRIGQVAWDAVHNHGAFRRDFPNDDYLEAVGAAVLAAVEPAMKHAQAEALRGAANSGQALMFSPAVYVGPERLRVFIDARDWLHREADRIEREGAGDE